MKLSPISLAVLPLLTMFSAQAAVYQIVELDTSNKVSATSGVAATMQGNAFINGSTFLDFPFDLDSIDFESQAMQTLLTEEERLNAQNGIINSKVANVLLGFLINNPSLLNQPVGNTRVLLLPQNGVVADAVLRDSTGSRTNTEFAYAANSMGQIVGLATAPSTKQRFTPIPEPVDEDDEEQEEPEIPEIPQPFNAWVPEPGYMLGYVLDGTSSVLLPPAFTGLGGGMSAGQGINNSGAVVGFTSTGVSQETQTAVNGVCTGNSQPLAYCLNRTMESRAISLPNLISQIRSFQTVDTLPQGYNERAALWQLDSAGSASLVKSFGFLGNKATGQIAPASEEYDPPVYYSRATAINDDGVIVGHSLYTDSDRIVRFSDNFGFEYRRIYSAPHATVYQGDEVKAIIDPAEWIASIAVDINNQDLVTGYAYKSINSFVRAKLFTHDLTTNKTTFIDGFFNSSGTEPRDMNNSGQIVGRAEVIIGGTVDRRFHGFIYDSTANRFSDLNDLVGCDVGYTLVDATAINDNGEILATALIRRPLLDAQGQQQTDDSGTVIQQEQATVVKLRPIANGQPENCGGDQTQYERSSGGLGGVWLMLLAALPFLRRRGL